MKEIKLTQGKMALVDDNMYGELDKFKWHAFKGGNTFYAARQSPRVNGRQRKIKMDHIVLGKPFKGFEIDHRNGNGLDNQRGNLRIVTVRQNQQNQQNRKHGSKISQFPGVSKDKKCKKWRAYITINSKRKHLGCFITEIEAFIAYKQAVEHIDETVIGDY